MRAAVIGAAMSRRLPIGLFARPLLREPTLTDLAEVGRRGPSRTTETRHRECDSNDPHQPRDDDPAVHAGRVLDQENRERLEEVARRAIPTGTLAGGRCVCATGNIGNRAEALRVFGQCRELLRDELGASPSPQTEALFLKILRAGESPIG